MYAYASLEPKPSSARSLAANKALTTSQSAVLGMAASPVQALDMLSRPTPTPSCRTHFVGLAGCM